jgi:hypothetical protein
VLFCFVVCFTAGQIKSVFRVVCHKKRVIHMVIFVRLVCGYSNPPRKMKRDYYASELIINCEILAFYKRYKVRDTPKSMLKCVQYCQEY